MASSPTLRRIDVDELSRHLSTLEQELGDGGAIELTRNDQVIAEVRAKVVPITGSIAAGRPRPDFMGRLKAIWGDEVLPAGTTTQWIRDDRDGL